MVTAYLVAPVQEQRQACPIDFFHPGANYVDLSADECIRRTQRRRHAALQEGFRQRWTLVGQRLLAIDQRDRTLYALKANSKCGLSAGVAGADNGDAP